MFKTQNSKYNVVAGKVTFVNNFKKETGSGVSLTFKTKDEEVVVIFKDNEKTNYTDRFAKAGVKSGSKVACYVGTPNESDGKIFYTGFEFAFPGKIFEIKNEDNTKTNIFFGNIGEARIGKSGQMIIGGAVNAYNKDTKERTTEWINFSFWNTENGAKNADNASKILAKGDTVVIQCSDITEFKAESGNVSKNARVYRFTKIYG